MSRQKRPANYNVRHPTRPTLVQAGLLAISTAVLVALLVLAMARGLI